VEVFEQAAVLARCSEDPAAYRAAIDLYAGELLPTDRYEGWAEQRRGRLRETHLSLLLGLARRHEERREHDFAAEVLREVLAEDPAREEAHVGLMRLHALRGRQGEALRQYERLEEVLSRELGVEPAATSRALREEIAANIFPPNRQQRAVPEPTTPPKGQRVDNANTSKHNLPVQRTTFLGREREMLEVRRDLAMTRLLTLTGTGGVGKTRLALEVARELAPAYPDGAWVVELAGLSEPELVPAVVAETLGVHEQPGRPLIDSLLDALRVKEMLMILDTCEHLIEACAGLSRALLSACPRLRILATSREALGIAGEASRVVPLLSVPEALRQTTVEELARNASTQLFRGRAQHRNPAFALTPENAEAVAEVCRRLEGIPLAIELAAARMDVFTVEQFAERLDRSLALLTSSSQGAEPRHRTLEATLDWSYELLSEPERKLLGRLSVFAGGFSLEAVEAVGAGDDIKQREVLKAFLSLVDKSLIVVEAPGDGRIRYRMLEPIRQYGLERLEDSGEVEMVRRRHAEFFLALAEEAEPWLRGPEQAAWFARLDAENDNLRKALSWLLEQCEGEPALRLSGALGEFWHVRGHLEEGRRWLEAALASEDAAPARIKALLHAGWLASEQMDYERSDALGEEALTLAREQGDSAATGMALYSLGAQTLYQLDFDRAAVLFEEAAQFQRSVGDIAGLARTMQALGLIATASHDFELAAKLHEESLTLAREAEDQLGIILSLGMGAFAYLGQGNHRRARELFEEGLKSSRSLGAKHYIAFCLYAAAALASAQSQPVRSARLWGAGESVMEDIGIQPNPVERYHYGPYVDSARSLLGEAAWEAAFAEGMAMSDEEAVEYALSEEVTPSPVGPSAGGRTDDPLTRREREVAELVARGLTNRQIASELHLSERTIGNHVTKILRKLGLTSRAQVATWATQQRLRIEPSSD
jgi:non-specific serine/threonine protein kinase